MQHLIPIWIPKILKQKVIQMCDKEGLTLNDLVVSLISERVSAAETKEFFTARGAQADVPAAQQVLNRAGGQPPAPHDTLDAKGS